MAAALNSTSRPSPEAYMDPDDEEDEYDDQVRDIDNDDGDDDDDDDDDDFLGDQPGDMGSDAESDEDEEDAESGSGSDEEEEGDDDEVPVPAKNGDEEEEEEFEVGSDYGSEEEEEEEDDYSGSDDDDDEVPGVNVYELGLLERLDKIKIKGETPTIEDMLGIFSDKLDKLDEILDAYDEKEVELTFIPPFMINNARYNLPDETDEDPTDDIDKDPTDEQDEDATDDIDEDPADETDEEDEPDEQEILSRNLVALSAKYIDEFKAAHENDDGYDLEDMYSDILVFLAMYRSLELEDDNELKQKLAMLESERREENPYFDKLQSYFEDDLEKQEKEKKKRAAANNPSYTDIVEWSRNDIRRTILNAEKSEQKKKEVVQALKGIISYFYDGAGVSEEGEGEGEEDDINVRRFFTPTVIDSIEWKKGIAGQLDKNVSIKKVFNIEQADEAELESFEKMRMALNKVTRILNSMDFNLLPVDNGRFSQLLTITPEMLLSYLLGLEYLDQEPVRKHVNKLLKEEHIEDQSGRGESLEEDQDDQVYELLLEIVKKDNLTFKVLVPTKVRALRRKKREKYRAAAAKIIDSKRAVIVNIAKEFAKGFDKNLPEAKETTAKKGGTMRKGGRDIYVPRPYQRFPGELLLRSEYQHGITPASEPGTGKSCTLGQMASNFYSDIFGDYTKFKRRVTECQNYVPELNAEGKLTDKYYEDLVKDTRLICVTPANAIEKNAWDFIYSCGGNHIRDLFHALEGDRINYRQIFKGLKNNVAVQLMMPIQVYSFQRFYLALKSIGVGINEEGNDLLGFEFAEPEIIRTDITKGKLKAKGDGKGGKTIREYDPQKVLDDRKRFLEQYRTGLSKLFKNTIMIIDEAHLLCYSHHSSEFQMLESVGGDSGHVTADKLKQYRTIANCTAYANKVMFLTGTTVVNSYYDFLTLVNLSAGKFANLPRSMAEFRKSPYYLLDKMVVDDNLVSDITKNEKAESVATELKKSTLWYILGEDEDEDEKLSDLVQSYIDQKKKRASFDKLPTRLRELADKDSGDFIEAFDELINVKFVNEKNEEIEGAVEEYKTRFEAVMNAYLTKTNEKLFTPLYEDIKRNGDLSEVTKLEFFAVILLIFLQMGPINLERKTQVTYVSRQEAFNIFSEITRMAYPFVTYMPTDTSGFPLRRDMPVLVGMIQGQLRAHAKPVASFKFNVGDDDDEKDKNKQKQKLEISDKKLSPRAMAAAARKKKNEEDAKNMTEEEKYQILIGANDAYEEKERSSFIDSAIRSEACFANPEYFDTAGLILGKKNKAKFIEDMDKRNTDYEKIEFIYKEISPKIACLVTILLYGLHVNEYLNLKAKLKITPPYRNILIYADTMNDVALLETTLQYFKIRPYADALATRRSVRNSRAAAAAAAAAADDDDDDDDIRGMQMKITGNVLEGEREKGKALYDGTPEKANLDTDSLERYNELVNRSGFMKILIFSDAGSVGIDYKETDALMEMKPPKNIARGIQTEGRPYRFMSHKDPMNSNVDYYRFTSMLGNSQTETLKYIEAFHEVLEKSKVSYNREIYRLSQTEKLLAIKAKKESVKDKVISSKPAASKRTAADADDADEGEDASDRKRARISEDNSIDALDEFDVENALLEEFDVESPGSTASDTPKTARILPPVSVEWPKKQLEASIQSYFKTKSGGDGLSAGPLAFNDFMQFQKVVTKEVDRYKDDEIDMPKKVKNAYKEMSPIIYKFMEEVIDPTDSITAGSTLDASFTERLPVINRLGSIEKEIQKLLAEIDSESKSSGKRRTRQTGGDKGKQIEVLENEAKVLVSKLAAKDNFKSEKEKAEVLRDRQERLLETVFYALNNLSKNSLKVKQEIAGFLRQFEGKMVNPLLVHTILKNEITADDLIILMILYVVVFSDETLRAQYNSIKNKLANSESHDQELIQEQEYADLVSEDYVMWDKFEKGLVKYEIFIQALSVNEVGCVMSENNIAHGRSRKGLPCWDQTALPADNDSRYNLAEKEARYDDAISTGVRVYKKAKTAVSKRTEPTSSSPSPSTSSLSLELETRQSFVWARNSCSFDSMFSILTLPLRNVHPSIVNDLPDNWIRKLFTAYQMFDSGNFTANQLMKHGQEILTMMHGAANRCWDFGEYANALEPIITGLRNEDEIVHMGRSSIENTSVTQIVRMFQRFDYAIPTESLNPKIITELEAWRTSKVKLNLSSSVEVALKEAALNLFWSKGFKSFPPAKITDAGRLIESVFEDNFVKKDKSIQELMSYPENFGKKIKITMHRPQKYMLVTADLTTTHPFDFKFKRLFWQLPTAYDIVPKELQYRLVGKMYFSQSAKHFVAIYRDYDGWWFHDGMTDIDTPNAGKARKITSDDTIPLFETSAFPSNKKNKVLNDLQPMYSDYVAKTLLYELVTVKEIEKTRLSSTNERENDEWFYNFASQIR